MRSIVVSYSTNILVNVLTALLAFRLLRQLRFSVRESVLGVLALMFCTTHLHYTQNMMENNYIMLLTLTGFSFQYEWLRTGNRRALCAGSAALGLNLLTRLTTGLDLIAAGVFILLVLFFEPVRGRDLRQRFVGYCKVTAPVYAFFLLIDRLYQFYRFGSFTNTYVSLFAKEQRLIDPTLPANFPWSTPFREGFLGPLFKPEKSIFLFDPLLALAILLLAVLWKRLLPEVRAYAVASLLLLFAYISFYARYTYWAGDFAWGDRYVSTSVELATLLAVPLLLRYREDISASVWRGGVLLVVASLAIQLASLAFWLPLEIYQMDTLGHPTFVICSSLQEHRRFCSRQNGGVGIEQRLHDVRPLGLRSHYDLEFSAVSAAQSWSGADVGGGCGVCCLGIGDCGFGLGSRAVRVGVRPPSEWLRPFVNRCLDQIQIQTQCLESQMHIANPSKRRF